MSLFDWLFRQGRTHGSGPPRHTAGKWLLPAAVQRAHLEIADVDPATATLRRIDGTHTAVARVLHGYPQHARGNDETMRFLREVCRALNALPDGVVLISRARTGGLERYAIEARQQQQRLPAGHALSKVLVDQAHHAIGRMRAGLVRETHNYLVAHGKTAREARTRLDDALVIFQAAQIAAQPLTDGALMAAVTASWQPRSVEHFVQDFFGPDGDVVCSLTYSPGNARVTRPRYGAQETTNHAPSLAAPASAAALSHARAARAPLANGAAARRKRLPAAAI